MPETRYRPGRHSRRWARLLAGLVLLLGVQQASACTPTIACLDCQDDGNGQYTATAGQEVTFRLWPTGCAVLTTDWRVDGTTESSQTGAQYKFYYTFPEPTEPGTPHTVRAVIEHDSSGTTIPVGSNTISVNVTAGAFTVNILPSAGCTVLAGDGGIDDAEAEGNGIVCSGGTAVDDPLCTEQYENSQIASLKVIPEEGYGFNGWIVDGAQIELTSAEPLFLATMPMLAQAGEGPFPIQSDGNTEVEASCSTISLAVQSVTFSGMAAEVVRDDNSHYPETQAHWQASLSDSEQVPVVFTRNATMRIEKASFQLSPIPCSSPPVFILGEGPMQADGTNIVFPPKKGELSADGRTLTIEDVSAEHPFADRVAMFGGSQPKMTISWKYTDDATCMVNPDACEWTPIGESEHLVYVTMNTPQSTAYHTLVHLGCEAGATLDQTQPPTKEKVLDAIWNIFQRNSENTPPMEVRRVRPDGLQGEALMYYGKWENGHNDTTADLLNYGDGACDAWVRFFIDTLKVQGLDYKTELVRFRYSYGGLLWEKGRFLVKNWDFQQQTSPDTEYPYENIPKALDDEKLPTHETVSGIPDYKLLWESTDVVERAGVEGQGNLDPFSLFPYHVLVSVSEPDDPIGANDPVHPLYDPAYGEYYETREDIRRIIAGYGYLNDPLLGDPSFRFKENLPTSKLELTGEIASY